MANIIGYTINLEDMKSSTCGMIGVAQKDGKKYFCKKFNNPVEPDNNGALSPKARAKNQAAFDEFRRRKTRVNRTLRDIAGLGGNIVFPIEETVYDHHWTEFTEYIEGTMPEDRYSEVIRGLDENEKMLVLKIAMGALQTIHGQRIIHGDLKLTNIMLVKNDMGHFVSKIIDFDGDFFEDDVPLDSIIGTVDYYSPELAVYSSNEDPEFRKKVSKMMTTKSDIFTMGLILHEYLTGEKPKPDRLSSSLQRLEDAGKFIYPWQIVLTNDRGEEKTQLVISSAVSEPAYVALISDMLNLEPEKRPSAVEVLKRLNNKELPIEADTWPEHDITINVSRAKEQVIGLRKLEVTKEKEVVHAYEIMEKDGRRYIKSKEELVSLGLALMAESWTPPRTEDKIRWNMDELKKMFISIAPDVSGRYFLFDKRGNKRIMTVSQLVMMRFAERTEAAAASTATPFAAARPATTVSAEARPVTARSVSEPSVTETPVVKTVTESAHDETELWDEDRSYLKLNTELFGEKNITFLGRIEMGGIKGYKFMINGMERCMNSQTCKMMNFLIKK